MSFLRKTNKNSSQSRKGCKLWRKIKQVYRQFKLKRSQNAVHAEFRKENQREAQERRVHIMNACMQEFSSKYQREPPDQSNSVLEQDNVSVRNIRPSSECTAISSEEQYIKFDSRRPAKVKSLNQGPNVNMNYDCPPTVTSRRPIVMNAPNMMNTPNVINTSSMINTPILMNTPNMVNTPNVMRTPDIMHIPNSMNTQDTMNTPNAMNTLNAMNTPNDMNTPNAMNTTNTMNTTNNMDTTNGMNALNDSHQETFFPGETNKTLIEMTPAERMPVKKMPVVKTSSGKTNPRGLNEMLDDLILSFEKYGI